MKLRYIVYSILWITAIILLSNYVNAKEIKVMEIDSGLEATHTLIEKYIDKDDLANNPQNYVDSYTKTIYGHGTHVGYLIVKDTCKQVKLISCKVYFLGESNDQMWLNTLRCFKRAKDENMDYINYSSNGEDSLDIEYNMLKSILETTNIVMVVAAGNEGRNLGSPCYGAFPACYRLKNLIPVGNLNEDLTRHITSNYGMVGMKWMVGTNVLSALPKNLMGRMTGTSQATAIYTNSLLKERCKELNNE